LASLFVLFGTLLMVGRRSSRRLRRPS
jgi:hypothetical protein